AERYDPSSAGGDTPGGSLPEGDYLSVSVTDSGAGIDSVLLRRVLEPFFTTKEPAKTRGFGLSRSYGFARQSRGALYLHSATGNGTTVTLVIPVAP
ncbi:MAG: ATP-binding protein, partial [Gammaproteobacteria bacterium]|nr:ATP-binding protein [Gammaproteobacteria bacterium]